MTRLVAIATLATAFAFAAASVPVSAQEAWPARPVTIVVPFGPGSGTDVGARVLGQRLSESLGQQVVVNNRPGAQGVIAAEFASRAKPDGYTLLMGTNSTHGANPGLFKELRYDPLKGFEPITRVAVFTSIVVANPNLPARSMKDLIALGRTKELTLGTGNASGVVMGETLARQVGWKLLRVPFKSNPDAMTEVVAGRVDFMFTDIAAAMGQLKAGTLRPMAVTSKQRSTLLPDLPTLAESGAPDYDLSGWIALFAPAGTPRAIVERLNVEVTRALQQPEVRKALTDLGAEPSPMPVAEFGEWVGQEVSKWTRLVREAGIQPE
jgi:tripartite-type tricarboxylate transporter receptor subunit TctC